MLSAKLPQYRGCRGKGGECKGKTYLGIRLMT